MALISGFDRRAGLELSLAAAAEVLELPGFWQAANRLNRAREEQRKRFGIANGCLMIRNAIGCVNIIQAAIQTSCTPKICCIQSPVAVRESFAKKSGSGEESHSSSKTARSDFTSAESSAAMV